MSRHRRGAPSFSGYGGMFRGIATHRAPQEAFIHLRALLGTADFLIQDPESFNRFYNNAQFRSSLTVGPDGISYRLFGCWRLAAASASVRKRLTSSSLAN